MVKMYVGRRDKLGKAMVRIIGHDGDTRELPERRDLFNHSPSGFDWGFGGSGPSQLALAILADAIGNDPVALRLYPEFKWAVIAKLPKDHWRLTHMEVMRAAGQCAIRRPEQPHW